MKKQLKHKFKILFGILLSLIVVNVLTPQVFLGNTPDINPQVASNLLNGPQQFLARFTPQSQEDYSELGSEASIPENVVFSAIAPGVQAAEDPSTSTRYLKIQNGTKIEVRKVKLENGEEVEVVSFPQ